MNFSDPLPDDLLQLEAELVGRPKAEPAPGLRGRVLGAVRAELGRTVSRRSALRSFWGFAAGAAAAAFLCANFAMSLTRDTDCGLRRRLETADLASAAREIRAVLPELTEREALRQAVLLRAGPPAAPIPVIHGRAAGHHRVSTPKEG